VGSNPIPATLINPAAALYGCGVFYARPWRSSVWSDVER
jgi:hypothetical protein